MTRHVVLLVEPNPRVADIIQESIRPLAQVQHHLEFESARRRLGAARFDFVVSNLRLGAFNGLHLAYAVNAVAAQDVRRAGAFYEVSDRLPVTLPAYLAGDLPSADRRDAAVPDRRAPFRGGRRSWDRQLFDALA
jgi:hypothetical protein